MKKAASILKPMAAYVGSEKDLSLPHRIFEPKLDGIRALCYVNKSLHFYSRNQITITADYPEFAFRQLVKAKSAILDGEIVVLDELLKPRFHLWQLGHTAVYIVFDILMVNGKSLIDLPLLERKKILEETISNGPFLEKILYTTNGDALWKEMLKRDMEGVVAKDENSLYYPGKRSRAWLKIKAYKTLEALITGYIPGKRPIGALVLGIYNEQKQLVPIGKVGTGFSESFLQELKRSLKKREVKQEKGVVWVKPDLVCEIKYLEFTPGGIVRAPVFLRLRPDKNPQEVTFKEQQIRV